MSLNVITEGCLRGFGIGSRFGLAVTLVSAKTPWGLKMSKSSAHGLGLANTAPVFAADLGFGFVCRFGGFGALAISSLPGCPPPIRDK
jgi:hypothetical protein